MIEEKKFQKRVEDFACGHCGFFVSGNGFTNHCPKCLWSKHLDENPGDRAAKCGGMMEPIAIEEEAGERYVLARCVKCGHTRRNKISAEDDFDAVLAIAQKRVAA